MIKKLLPVPFWFIVLGSKDDPSEVFKLPNNVFISKTIPEGIKESKEMNWNEVQIPGGFTSIHRLGSFSAGKVSFNIKLVDFNDEFGVTLQTAIFEQLRLPDYGYIEMFGGSENKNIKALGLSNRLFRKNPRILMQYGLISSIPQVYNVRSINIDPSKPNQFGRPQVANINIDLVLDEEHFLNQLSQMYNRIAQFAGAMKTLVKTYSKDNPYRNKNSIKLGGK